MKSLFLKIWKDPVWSKVIAVAITGTSLFLWNKISINTFDIFFAWLKVEYHISLWIVISFVLLLLLKMESIISLFKSQSFDHERNRSIIEKAVYEKRNITGFNLLLTGIRNDTNFIEFCLKDYSETWLVQEIASATLTSDIKRQIRIVNRHLDNIESRHKKVIIIILVYKKLKDCEKINLYNQLLLFSSKENLTPKISFQVWDKIDVDDILGK